MDKQTISIITNVILIVLLIAIGLYLFFNIDYAKQLILDPCKVCMEKTGSVCYYSSPISMP